MSYLLLRWGSARLCASNWTVSGRVVAGMVIFERVGDVTLGRTGRLYALYFPGFTGEALEDHTMLCSPPP